MYNVIYYYVQSLAARGLPLLLIKTSTHMSLFLIGFVSVFSLEVTGAK